MKTASVEGRLKRVVRIIYSVAFGVFWYYSPFNRLRRINFLPDDKIVDEFLRGKSVARFGDGELRIMEDVPSDFFQKNDKKLANSLIRVANEKNKNLIVCLPKPLRTLGGLNFRARLFWISNIYWNRRAWKKYVDLNRAYGDTQITRPYIDYKNKALAEGRYRNLKRIWDGKKICIIEGERTHLGEGNDLLDNSKEIKRILAPAKNAFEEFDEILEKAKRIDEDFIFLVALGPTATILVSELSKLGRVAFDVGHVDVEYEWMSGGAKRKIAIDGKAVNESGKSMAVRVIEAVKRIKLKDFLAPFIFLIILMPSWIFRLINKIRGKELWLVAEDGEARDNGYHFYRYVRENHPRDFCFYAIKPTSVGYSKVSGLGNIINWGSLRHWLFYMSANLNISSQKSGNPCPIFWYFIHVTLGLYRNRVFLQHGITKDDAEWLYFSKTKFKYFVCGTKMEFDFIKKKFGYPEGSLLLTGFPRWDDLVDLSVLGEKKSILIMPTWRNWLGGEKNILFGTRDFEKTVFYKYWNGLLNDCDFINFIEAEDIKVYFYPHINMQGFINSFTVGSNNIEVVLPDREIQEFFNRCDVMVTDYSSVAFDFAYLGKPVIYYQFDKKEYREKQYKEGYFDYSRDGFGPVVEDEKEVVCNITDMCLDGLPDKYNNRIKLMFTGERSNNSERVYSQLHLKRTVRLENEKVKGGGKKVSIIVPAYNSAVYISRCLKHLTNQTYENIEILVIDDGSSDNTFSIANNYAALDHRIRVIKQEHMGPNVARLRGIDEATGDYVMFVDADDFIVDWSVAKIVDGFMDECVDVVRFGGERFPMNKPFNKIALNTNEDNAKIGHDDVVRLLLTTYKLNSLCIQAYKLKNIKGIESFDSGRLFGEDFLANLEIHKSTKKMLILDMPIYHYCNNPDSTTRKTTRECILNKVADRVYISNVAISYVADSVNGEKFQNEVIYAQIKMIRDCILDVARIDGYSRVEFMKDFRKILPKSKFMNIDLEKLNRYIKTLGLVEMMKNRRIVNAIVRADYGYIWKYVCLYGRVRRSCRWWIA